MTHSPNSDSLLASARTLLFVPGNRPERFAKALLSGADAVVLDLEDSVPLAEKAMARESIAKAWPDVIAATTPFVVRISSLATQTGQDDLAWLARMPRGAGVMLAKTESSDQLGAIAQAIPGLSVLPLIESAAGFMALGEIARSTGVLRLVVGHIDFMADTGMRCSDDERELDTLRFNVAMHTRVNRLASAVDGVTAAFDDDARLRTDTLRALNFGFGAKLCIHPRQVQVVHAAIAPSDAELDWARRILAADQTSGGAAVQLEGRMVDLPVVLQARLTLARARVSTEA